MVAEDVSYTSILRISLPALLLNGDPQLMSRSLCSLQCDSYVVVTLLWFFTRAVAAPLVVTIQTALLGRFCGSAAQAAFAAVGTTANATCLLFNFLVDGISAKACFQGWALSIGCANCQNGCDHTDHHCDKT